MFRLLAALGIIFTVMSGSASADTVVSTDRYNKLVHEIATTGEGFDGRVVMPDKYGYLRIFRPVVKRTAHGAMRMFLQTTICASGCTYNDGGVSATRTTNWQAAVNAAAHGDDILTERGVTIETNTSSGTGILPVKSGSCEGAHCYTVIRTGVEANGALIDSSEFPAANNRICPVGETRCTPNTTVSLTKYTPAVSNDPALRTVQVNECGAPPCIPRYWKLQHIEAVPNLFTGLNLVTIGWYNWGGGEPNEQDTKAKTPMDFILDQVFIRGLPDRGQHRCLAISAGRFSMTNSYFKDCWTRQNDGQAWMACNTQGPLEIINNYFEGSTEGSITCGLDPAMRYLGTVNGVSSTTVIPLDAVPDLEPLQWVRFACSEVAIVSSSVASPTVITTAAPHGFTNGKVISIRGHSGSTPSINSGPSIWKIRVLSATTFSLHNPSYSTTEAIGYVNVTVGGTGGFAGLLTSSQLTDPGISGTTVTVSPALPCSPVIGSEVRWTTQVQDILVEYNHYRKPVSWRDAIVATPSNPLATGSATGGSLTNGTYYMRMTATRFHHHTAETLESTRSLEFTCVVPGVTTTGSCNVTWGASEYVDAAHSGRYRVYVGTSSGSYTGYFEQTVPSTLSLTYTGGAGTAGSPPSLGHQRGVKNMFEFKSVIRATVRYNIFEGNWTQAQPGDSILFSVVNDDSRNSSAVVRLVTFEYNEVIAGPGCFALSTDDYQKPTGQMSDVTIRHNLCREMGTQWGDHRPDVFITGGNSPAIIGTVAAKRIIIDHNTFDANGQAPLNFNLCDPGPSSGFACRTVENMTFTNNIHRGGSYEGIMATIDGAVFPPTGNTKWVAATSGVRTYGAIIIAEANCANHTAGTICPANEAAFQALFTSYGADNFRCASGQPCHGAAISGYSHIGADIDTLETFTAIARSGVNVTGAAVPSRRFRTLVRIR